MDSFCSYIWVAALDHGFVWFVKQNEAGKQGWLQITTLFCQAIFW